MRPLTLTAPKPMVRVGDKPILRHIIDALPPKVDELVLVIGYFRDQIRDYFGDEFSGKKITYVVQEQKRGTADALRLCKNVL